MVRHTRGSTEAPAARRRCGTYGRPGRRIRIGAWLGLVVHVAEASARLATRGSARVERVPKARARPDPEHAALDQAARYGRACGWDRMAKVGKEDRIDRYI